MSRTKVKKRNAYRANDKINLEDEQEFRFLRTPRCGENQVTALVLLDKHIKWLTTRVKREYGEISILIQQGQLPELVRPVPVGTPLAAEGPSEQARPARQAAFSLRSDTTKNSFKVLGQYLSNIEDDFDPYISNKAETKRANGINEIITNNNINYCIRFKDCRTTNATNSVHVASSKLKAITTV